MADSILSFQEPARRREAGEAGYRYAREALSLQQMGQALEAVYREALTGP